MTTRNLKRLLLLRLSNLLTESAEWGEIGFLLNCEDLIQKHPRLLRSRYNNDDDYPSCVLDVVNQIEAKSPKLIDQLIEHTGFKEWLRSKHASDFQALYLGTSGKRNRRLARNGNCSVKINSRPKGVSC